MQHQSSTPPHIIITPYSQEEDDDCSELMPRSRPVPISQQPAMQQQQAVRVPPPSSSIGDSTTIEMERKGQQHDGMDEHQRLRKENNQLRTILRDLGLSSLLPWNENRNQQADEESSAHSSQLSVSFFQHLKNPHSNANTNANANSNANANALSSEVSARTMNADVLLAEIQFERNQLFQITQTQSMEITNLHSELHALSLSHESATKESSRFHTELSSLREHLQQERNQIDALQNDIRTIQEHRNELWRDINVCLDEKRKLEQELHCEKRLIQQSMLEKDEFQRDCLECNQRVDSLERELQKRIGQVADLEGEQEKSCMEVDRLKNFVRGLEREKGGLAKDLDSSRMNSEYNCSKTLELQQLAAKCHGDSQAFQGMMMDLEAERNEMRKLVEEQKNRILMLEEAMSNVEVDEGAAGDQIRKLVREKAQMVTKLNEANARLGRSTPLSRSVSKNVITSRSSDARFKVKGTKLFSPTAARQETTRTHDHSGTTKHSVSFAPFDEGDTSARKSLQEKQRAVELSLQELELLSPSQNHMIGSSAKKAEMRNISKRDVPSLIKDAMKISNDGEKENHNPNETGGNKNDSDTDFDTDSLSLLEPLSLHDSLSPPTKISLKRESQSLLDFLSQDDDASTLI